jgi:hypothetical protein
MTLAPNPLRKTIKKTRKNAGKISILGKRQKK